VREHFEDRVFWMVLWAFIAAVAIVVGRSGALSSVHPFAINIALFAIVGFLVCVARAIADAMWRSDDTETGARVIRIYLVTGRRITGAQAAALFVLAVVVVGLGPALLFLLVASIFIREY